MTWTTGHVALDHDAMRAALLENGLPAWLVNVYLQGNELVRTSRFDEVASDVHAGLTGTPRRSLRDFLSDHVATFQARAA